MTAFRIIIDGRIWEGCYNSFGNAVFGACRADENVAYKDAKEASEWLYGHSPGCRVTLGGLKSSGAQIVHDWQCDCGATQLRNNYARKRANEYHAETQHTIHVSEIASTAKKIHRV